MVKLRRVPEEVMEDRGGSPDGRWLAVAPARRVRETPVVTVVFGEFVIDPARFELRRSGVRIPMEPQAFDVLAYLAAHPDRLVTKEELMDQIWGGRFVTESAVTSRIKQARRAVGDDGRSQRVIATVHSRGYRFVGDTMDQRGEVAPSAGLSLAGEETPATDEEGSGDPKVARAAGVRQATWPGVRTDPEMLTMAADSGAQALMQVAVW